MYTHRKKANQNLLFQSDKHQIKKFVQIKATNPSYFDSLRQAQFIKIHQAKIKIVNHNLKCLLQKYRQRLTQQLKKYNQVQNYVIYKSHQHEKIDSSISNIREQSNTIQKTRKQNNDKIIKDNKLKSQQYDFQVNQVLKKIQVQKSSIRQYKNEHVNRLFIMNEKINKLNNQKHQKQILLQNKSITQSKITNLISQKTLYISQLNQKQNQLNQTIKKFKYLKQNQISKYEQLQHNKSKKQKESQQQCAKKMCKFIGELKDIIYDKKNIYQEKKCLIDMLFNVYCNTQKKNQRNYNPQFTKRKHSSIETNFSQTFSYRDSQDLRKYPQDKFQSQRQSLDNQKIPQQLLYSLRKLQKSKKIDILSISQESKSPKKVQKVEIDIQKLQNLEKKRDKLQKQESKLDSDIKQLQIKCVQKDNEIAVYNISMGLSKRKSTKF